MPDYRRIRTKDKIIINDIPIGVGNGDPRLSAYVEQLRAAGIKEGSFLSAYPDSASPPPPPTYGDVGAQARLGGATPMPSPGDVLPSAAPEEGKTDPLGLMGSVIRGAGPVAMGTGLGFALGGPPGALAGAGSMALTQFVGDPLVDVINQVLGTKLTRPTDALKQLFDAIGIPEADSAAERVLKAASSGAGGAAGTVALGQALASAAKPLAPSMVKAIGDALAAGAVQQVAGGAGGAASSQTAAEMGAPWYVQIPAGLGGGMLASRMVPGSANLRTPAVKTAEELSDDVGRLVKKASSFGPGRAAAREKLVKIAQVNPEARAAAERLGFELPADIFIDNPQVRSAAGLARSVSGGEMEGAWRASVQNALDKADDIIRQYDAVFVEGSPAPSVVSSRVKDSLTRTREALSKQAADLYAEVEKAIPKETPVRLDKLASTLDDIVREVGTDGLSAQETRLLAMAKTAGKPSGATYGRLLREKNLIGQAIARKESPYGNMEAGTLKRLYGALAEDQLANVDTAGPGMGEQLRSANLIYSKERELGNRIVEAFGNDLEGSIASTMKTAIVSASKGDGAKFSRMLENVPADLQKETVATSLASVARNRRGEFGFAEYAQTYKGLRANPEVYSKIVKTLGPEADEVMRDLYEVSKRITDARANVLTTGKANQALLQSMTAESLLGKILGATVVRTGTTSAGAAIGGVPGAAFGSVLADAITHGKKDTLRAAGKMFTSPKFQNLITAAAEGRIPNISDVRALARDSTFQAFAKAARLPLATDQQETWLFGALMSGAFQPGGIQGEK